MGENGGRSITRGQWLTLAAALLGWLFDGFEMGIFPLVARPALVEVLGLSDDARLAADKNVAKDLRDEAKKRIDGVVGPWNSYIVAAFLVGAALGGWLFGWLGDRLGRVRAMAISVFTYAAFTGLCGLAQQAWHLAVLRFLSALGMGGEWALGVALVMESWPARARPVLAGLIGAAANFGYLLTVVPVELIKNAGVAVDAGGWRWVLGLCAFPALLTFLLRLFVPESEKWQHAVQTGPKPGLADIFTPQLRRRTLLGALLGGVALVATWGSVQWIPLWVGELTTGNQDMVNRSQICSSAGAIAGAFLGAVLGQRFGRRPTYFLLCLASLVVCAVLFRWHWTVQPGSTGATLGVGFFAVIFLTGALTASFYGWLPLYLPELFPTRVRATGQGFSFNAGRIIAAAGALSMGFLMSDRVFHGDYAAAGATVTLVYVVGLLVVWFVPETRGQALPE